MNRLVDDAEHALDSEIVVNDAYSDDYSRRRERPNAKKG
jgi:hypothetical protein